MSEMTLSTPAEPMLGKDIAAVHHREMDAEVEVEDDEVRQTCAIMSTLLPSREAEAVDNRASRLYSGRCPRRPVRGGPAATLSLLVAQAVEVCRARLADVACLP